MYNGKGTKKKKMINCALSYAVNKRLRRCTQSIECSYLFVACYTQRDQSRKELGPETRRINWPILIALMKEQINQHCFIWGYTMQRPISITYAITHEQCITVAYIYIYIYLEDKSYLPGLSAIRPIKRINLVLLLISKKRLKKRESNASFRVTNRHVEWVTKNR